jgi:hypothetical protein
MPQPIELIWARYDKTQQSKYHLLIYFGEHAGNSYAAEAELIPDHEIAILRINLDEIRKLPMTELITWIAKNTPILYNRSLKKFKTEQLIIKTSYNLKPITQSKQI